MEETRDITQNKKIINYILNEYNYTIEDNNEREYFLIYCEYMLFSYEGEPYPLHNDKIKPYFKGLYKAVENKYNERN